MTIFSQRRPKYGEDPNFTPNTVIGEGVTFRGGIIKGANSVMVSGLVFGDINVDGEVIITDTGYVKGNIVSTFAVVAGIVEGNINLTSYASLKATASVTGDISCTAINIEDGAVFTGTCNMIVKSNALTKKLKKISEQAAALEEWQPPRANQDDLEADVTDADEYETDDVEILEDAEEDNRPEWLRADGELPDDLDEQELDDADEYVLPDDMDELEETVEEE